MYANIYINTSDIFSTWNAPKAVTLLWKLVTTVRKLWQQGPFIRYLPILQIQFIGRVCIATCRM